MARVLPPIALCARRTMVPDLPRVQHDVARQLLLHLCVQALNHRWLCDLLPTTVAHRNAKDMAKMPAHSIGIRRRTVHSTAGSIAALFVVMLLLPSTAHASLLSPALEDKLATGIALFVIFVVPVVLIALFWMVHILPEQIAHKRNHPQFEAIRTLCLLSLVFGGLLWPIAWIWAYSKPVLHKMAYGTDTLHPEDGHGAEASGESSLRDRLARLEGRVPTSELKGLRADLEAIEAKFADNEAR